MKPAKFRYRSMVQDSARWEGFELRSGDIIISTPPKCGTTWTQMICALLIFQEPVPPRPLSELSPWLDMCIKTRAEVFALLGAQTHRRFIKTHTPLDGLPQDERVTYVCVGRDPRDAAVSWHHHWENMDDAVFFATRDKAIGNDDLPELLALDPPPLDQTPEGRFWHFVENPAAPIHVTSSLRSSLHHYDLALGARERPNVVVLHYGDLKRDLEGEMRRLAARLGIAVDETLWPSLVDAASFERMRSDADRVAPNAADKLWKSNRGFFHSGTGGGWREFFDADARKRYDARVSELASPQVASWAHEGFHGGGQR
jgi:hypothetical protein